KDNNASFSCAWGDYNNDAYMDLFIANYGNQNNCLYKNLGNGKFEKILVGNIVNDGGQSRSASWGDYNNDGHLDLYVTNSGQTNFLYKNNGNSTFTKITNDPMVADENWSFSATWSDINNDSYLDMVVVNSTSTDSVSLFMNNKNGTFSKLSDPTLFAEHSSSWSISACDYDRNGTADLYVASRGFNPSYLFKNQNTKSNFIGIALKGVISNHSGIGAAVEVKTAHTKQRKYIAANTGHGNQNGLQLLFGLDTDKEVDTIQIIWPSKTVQKLVNKAINQYYTIEECQPIQTTLQQAICAGDSLYFGNKYLKEASSYARLFLSATGCDSTVTLNLSVLPTFATVIDTTICDTCSYFAEGKWQHSAGIYYDTLQTVQGCDSIVTTNLKIEVTTGLPSLSSSNSHIYPNPTTGLVMITGINLNHYQILDVTGKSLLQKSNYLIDLSSLNNGLYLLLLTDKAGRITRKRIIKTF
ncbi:MAG: CRTAC1 family protein, partial [Saprospiraceae bacterium]|nr:CRTAC1 family protein [Saprospiraceae bacterium]